MDQEFQLFNCMVVKLYMLLVRLIKHTGLNLSFLIFKVEYVKH